MVYAAYHRAGQRPGETGPPRSPDPDLQTAVTVHRISPAGVLLKLNIRKALNFFARIRRVLVLTIQVEIRAVEEASGLQI